MDETKRRAFLIPCGLQCVLTYCIWITQKRETGKNEDIVLVFGATVQPKNGVRAHIGSFLQTH